MSLSHYQAVLFDLDGTLCDTALDFTLALNRLLADEQRPSLSLSQVRAHVSNGALAIIQKAFPDIEDEPTLLSLRRRLVEYYQQNIVWHTQVYPGLDKLLAQLASKQIPWGVVSNKPELLTREIMQRLDFPYAAHAIIGGDTLSVAKPHPEPLLLAAKACQIIPELCVYIGDHHRDVVAAKAAGMTAVAVSYGYINADENVHHWGADWVVDSPYQLLTLLNLSVSP
ncbi:MAG: HAD-IA family hydrolase [Gammaproteobacteria bacterium]|nr:HAD-IA family hydrolase [Gammaproteobacteria bacterium]